MPRRKHDPKDVSAGRKRPVLLFLVVVLCGTAFWYNFERRFADIEAEVALSDNARQLDKNERERVLALRTAFRELWGLGLKVTVEPNTPDSRPLPRRPATDPQTVLLTVQPGSAVVNTVENNAARVNLPPLVSALLHKRNPDFADAMETRLQRCMQTNRPGICIRNALADLLLALSESTTAKSALQSETLQSETLQSETLQSGAQMRAPLRAH